MQCTDKRSVAGHRNGVVLRGRWFVSTRCAPAGTLDMFTFVAHRGADVPTAAASCGPTKQQPWVQVIQVSERGVDGAPFTAYDVLSKKAYLLVDTHELAEVILMSREG